ncbi:MAG: outer membrane lipoprotein-sorting protein [Gammaproteobacteria bacterium]|nr:outer membrane lipoprotein-sorting protein [Gammaproteobacteria bacterium]
MDDWFEEQQEEDKSMPKTSLLRITGSLIGLILVAVFQMAQAYEGTPQEIGEKIAADARESAKGFDNFTANMKMTLRSKNGREIERALRLKVLETDNDGDKTLFVFDQPRDVKGTAFLVHAFKDKQDQQWLYLPALKRVKGISSSNQSGSFMGSEFSYEDLGTVEPEKYQHTYLRDEACGEHECYVLERIPKFEDSGYSRLLIWLDKEALRIKEVHYYDRRNEHLKTMVAEDFELYLDKFWRSRQITMSNHLTGKSTVLVWEDYVFGTDLDDGDFTRTALQRVR